LFQGLLVSGVAFAIWMILLRRYPAGRLVTIAFLTPLFGITLGTLIRGEAFTWPLALGGLLVGLGIYLVAVEK
jgi:drug/metabolite transporter (DMT)-like permease